MKIRPTVIPLIGLFAAAAMFCPATRSPAAEPAEPPAAGETSDADQTFPPGFIKEGPLPAGFPPPSAPGQVVEKTYPRSRTYWAAGNNAFMKCFAYLAQNKHEMTVPVIMDYQPSADDQKAPAGGDFGFIEVERMHFILEQPSLDEPKEEGPVTVADMSPLRVLSIAMQGGMSQESLAATEQQLADELARRKDIVAAGEKRVLGYNSPMVPRDKAYWEVQVPIENRPEGGP